jgi:hypothetical protein
VTKNPTAGDRGGRVTPEEKNRFLKKDWTIPERQIEISVVLADERWSEG